MKKLFSFISFLFGITIIFALVLFLSERERLKENFLEYLTAELEKGTGLALEIEQVGISFPFNLSFDRLIFSQNQEQILVASKVVMKVDLWEMLRHNITITELLIDHLKVANTPKALALEASEGHFNVGVKIRKLEILTLESSLFSLKPHLIGHLALDPAVGQVFLALQMISQPAELAFTYHYNAPYDFHLRLTLPQGYQLLATGELGEHFFVKEGRLQLSYQDLDSYGTVKSNYSILDHGIALEQISGVIGPFIMQGRGKINFNSQVDIDLNVRTNQHNFKGIQLNFIESQCHLEGMINNLHLDLESSINSLSYLDQTFKNCRLNSYFTYSQERLEGRCTLKSNRLNLEAAINCFGDQANCTINIPSLSIHETDVSNINISSTIHSPFQAPSGFVKVEADSATYQSISLEELFLDTYFDQNNAFWPFTFNCSNTQSQGVWQQDSQRTEIIFEQLENSEHSIKLAIPLKIVYTDQLTISPFDIQMGEGSLRGSYSQQQIHLKGTQFPIFYLPLEGRCSFDLELNENRGKLALTAHQVQFKENLLPTTPFDIELEAQLEDKLLSIDGKLLSKEIPLQLNAAIPLEASMQYLQFAIPDDRALKVDLALKSRIESLLEVAFPSAGLNLNGNLQLHLQLDGPLKALKKSGRLTLTEASYEILTLGASVSQGTVIANIVDNEIYVKHLDAQSKNGGSIQGEGKLLIDSAMTFPFEFAFSLSKIPLAPTEYAEAVASGNITFKGDYWGASLEGSLAADAMHIEIPEKIPELMHTVDVTFINTTRSNLKPQTIGWPVNLLLALNLPKGFITGKDLNSEWKGQARLSGTTNAPLIHGNFSILNGDYRLQGKPFQINEGVITFSGPFKKTSIYLIASRELDQIVAEVILKGPLRDPAIAFRSNPPLPQREILSWILFNSGTSDISEFQGTQLNESIKNLDNSQPDMLSKFRDRIGIDRIDISRENGTANEMSVQVGKYISRGILVSVNRSFTAETNRLAIEAALSKRVKVQADVGDDSDARLLLKWKKDY